MPTRNGVVALTDRRWYDFLRSRAVGGILDEVNFWRPKAQTSFHSLIAGEPFFFRLRRPVNKIAEYGFFAHPTKVPVRLVWEAFGERNGGATFDGFDSGCLHQPRSVRSGCIPKESVARYSQPR